MADVALKGLTVDAFVAGLGDDERVELWDGQITAMVGGTLRSGLIGLNVASAFKARLRGSSCRAFGDNMLVKINDVDAFSPDAMIVCSKINFGDRMTSDPVVIVEVLSPSTEPADRGYKWQAYRTLASLRHYLLVAQDRPEVELFSRESEGTWRYRVLEGDLAQSLELAPPGIRLSLAEIYEDIAFPRPGSGQEDAVS